MPALKARAPNHVNSREPYQKEGTVQFPALGVLCVVLGLLIFFRSAFFNLANSIARATSPFAISHEYPCTDKRQNVAQRGVLRALREFRPLRCRELSVKVVQDAVEYMPLPLVQGEISETLPLIAARSSIRRSFCGEEAAYSPQAIDIAQQLPGRKPYMWNSF